MRRRLSCGVLVVSLAVLGTACGDDTPTPTTPTPTIPITETFSGILTVNGGVTFPFVAIVAGEVTATMTAVAPDGSVVGMSIGTYNNTTCEVVLSNDTAAVNAQITGAVQQEGVYCARVYDVGRITEPVTFTLRVDHF